MTRKQIKELAKQSYQGSLLDQTMVEKIASSLKKRTDLKRFIRELTLLEHKKTVTIRVPKELDAAMQKSIQSHFPDKNVSIVVDPSLLMGVVIIENDTIFDMTLQSKFDHLVEYVSQSV